MNVAGSKMTDAYALRFIPGLHLRLIWPLGLIVAGSLSLCACGASGTGSSASSTSAGSDGTASQVVTSVVGGEVSGGGNSNVAVHIETSRSQRVSLERGLRAVSELVLPVAQAATWQCSGAGFSTSYAGPGSYTYTPISCTVDYRNGKSSALSWNGTFSYNFGASCSSTSSNSEFLAKNQTSGCAITRTSQASGTARTITGPEGNSYTVNHDTTGTNTGFESTQYPTTNAGVIMNCTAGNCATSTLTISGSHLTGTFTPAGGVPREFWDHTVSTTSGGLSISGTGTNTTITGGTVIVQHNLAKYTSSAAFSNVVFGSANCCFPTSGSITSTFSGGPFDGLSETLTFSASCGEAALTNTAGVQSSLTLVHCL